MQNGTCWCPPLLGQANNRPITCIQYVFLCGIIHTALVDGSLKSSQTSIPPLGKSPGDIEPTTWQGYIYEYKYPG